MKKTFLRGERGDGWNEIEYQTFFGWAKKEYNESKLEQKLGQLSVKENEKAILIMKHLTSIKLHES